jgi:preprotein translocase subunit Sss1/ribosomal protein L29
MSYKKKTIRQTGRDKNAMEKSEKSEKSEKLEKFILDLDGEGLVDNKQKALYAAALVEYYIPHVVYTNKYTKKEQEQEQQQNVFEVALNVIIKTHYYYDNDTIENNIQDWKQWFDEHDTDDNHTERDETAENIYRAFIGAGLKPGSKEWINQEASKLKDLAVAAKGKLKSPAKTTASAKKPSEDEYIKAIIAKLKAATIIINQPKTGIIEPQYKGEEPISSYTPPVIPAGLFMDVESRSKLKTIFQQRSNTLHQLQGEQKLNEVIGEYLRDKDGNEVENLRLPKTVILFLTQGMNKDDIGKFVENIGYLHEWIKEYPSMMDWIRELQKKPNEFTISDISSQDVTDRIKSLKEELTNLRAVLTNVPVEIKVDRLTGLGKSLYYKIIGGTGVGEAGSTLANLYDNTYRYVCKDLLKYSEKEMGTIGVDPTSLEQVYINYLISGLVVSLLILMLPLFTVFFTIIDFLLDFEFN